MITYICTAGTSIITETGRNLRDFSKWKLADWDKHLEEILEAEKIALANIKTKTDKDFPRTSAELNSLIKMGLTIGDRVVLIATETVEGKLCADLVKRALLDKSLCEDVAVKVIVGLQAQDGKRFQKEGLKNLITFISRYEHDNVIFNPTGGFKSVVPYITLAGMLFNKPVKYIHEFSDDLMTLANIPITFDEDILFAVEDKLQKIEKDTEITKEEWLTGIHPSDTRFDSLIEEIDGQVTFSGIGWLLWERFKADYPAALIRDTQLPHEKTVNINELIECNSSPTDKHVKLGTLPHHGRDIVMRLAKRIITSCYITAIPNSCGFQPHSRVPVKALSTDDAKKYTQVAQEGICIVTDCSTDAGFSLLIKTTGRYFQETELIASILTRKYF